MRMSRWPVLASALLAAGGLSWMIKIGIIVATDGRIITTGPAAALMTAGLVLLPLGAAGVGAGLARHAHVGLRAVAALGAVALLVAGSVALGIAGSTLFRGSGPSYLAEEAGLFAAGVVWFAVGLRTLRHARAVPAVARAVA